MNLRDKLRAVNAPPASAQNRPAMDMPMFTDCLHRQEFRSLTGFPGAFEVNRETLMLMQNEFLPADLDPRRILYLDTETTGFSGTGTVAFLVGTGFLTDSGFEIHQFLMRDYPEEPLLLKHVAGGLNRFDAVCTFNGKSFDIPLLRDRFLMNRMSPDCLDLPHIDLLHIARRLWKLRLGRCNLGRLEEVILGVPRVDDLPGSEVPQRYFTWLKNHDPRQLDPVMTHNAQDIATLCTLLARMCEIYRDPSKVTFGQDLISMAGGLERMDHPEEARRVWRLAADSPFRAEAGLGLARCCRRLGDRIAAAQVWQGMIDRHEGGVRPLIELAKYREHILKDIPGALELTRRARILLSEPTLRGNNTVQDELFAVQYRYDRLKRKMAAIEGDK